MSDEQINIAIAEACGWTGVPVEQSWRTKNQVRFWRSVAPREIASRWHSRFEASQIKRWLRKPDGNPALTLSGPVTVNNRDEYVECLVLEEFSGGWEEQTTQWPELKPSLASFIEYLPDYCNDLNAMHEAVNSLDPVQFGNWVWEVHMIVHGPDSEATLDTLKQLMSATARQRAEAFIRVLKETKKLSTTL